MTTKLKFRQLADLVVIPVLQSLDLYSPVALNLILGTAAQETAMEALAQDGGPALGIYQIEPATHQDLLTNTMPGLPALHTTMASFATPGMPLDNQLVGNLYYATAVARLLYYRIEAPLPDNPHPQFLGEYWKQYYNTDEGAGTVAEFVTNFVANIGDPLTA